MECNYKRGFFWLILYTCLFIIYFNMSTILKIFGLGLSGGGVGEKLINSKFFPEEYKPVAELIIKLVL